MQWFLISTAAITLLLYFGAAVEFTLGRGKIRRIESVEPIADAAAPRVTVVIPACNEERNIEEALTSVLAQDYPNFEVIAVDDRSTDATGEILDRMAARNPRLRVLHIHELPYAWLGKNNALQQGAARGAGELILFTDADVVYEQSVLRRATAYFSQNKLDHLTVPPRAIVHGFASHAFLAAFSLLFGLHTKPWKVRDPKSKYHLGVGAFNMVRASAYWGTGGHASIAMRPDDDMQLGRLTKLRGYRSDVLLGTELLSVEWYASFAELRQGLMKNFFAGLDYRVWLVFLVCALQLILFVWPFLALVATGGIVRWLNAAIVLFLFAAFALHSESVGIRWWWSFAMPAGILIGIYLLVRSTVFTLKNDGIEWRGTKYPLALLRANRVR